MIVRISAVLMLLAIIVGIPFFLRPAENLLLRADDSLVIISPHNEAIRYEFTQAFARYYQAKTGRMIRVDWRLVGGTSEIARYLSSEYFNEFKRFWENSGRLWTREVEAAFDNHRIVLPDSSEADDLAQSARRAFLKRTDGIGIDVFFGGGAFDFNRQAVAGRLVPSGIQELRPEWFQTESIPAMVSGELFYDPNDLWVGTCISAFGIIFNRDSLQRLGFEGTPSQWSDLTDPRFFKQVALADPTKSGSTAKAFEMVIQQKMQQRMAMGGADEATLLAEGWRDGLRLIQQASANARYFTDAAGKVPIDVSLGDAAIGMCIDFFGRFQSEANRPADGGESRVGYITPVGGSSAGVDPIGMLRGAPNPEVALAFIEFVLSIEGQKLWNYRVGEPGGPVRYALRRPPIRKEMYVSKHLQRSSDPEVNPYMDAGDFVYRPEWTGPLFRSMSFIIRVMSLDTHDEQRRAWRALVEADFPREAMAAFSDLGPVDYEAAQTVIRQTLSSTDRIEEVRLARDLGSHFRERYRETIRLAREGR